MLQRLLLEDEGVRFDTQSRIDLTTYRWHPERTDIA
jgi:alkylated DNA nucleotide flippase Atl1